MPPNDDEAALARFLSGEQCSDDFRHRDHLRVAFAMLGRHCFADAARLYSRGVRDIAARAGRPDAYHETITVAFLSIVAERMQDRIHPSFDDFLEANAELAEKALLTRWYTRERLESGVARRTFVLPEPIGSQR